MPDFFCFKFKVVTPSYGLTQAMIIGHIMMSCLTTM